MKSFYMDLPVLIGLTHDKKPVNPEMLSEQEFSGIIPRIENNYLMMSPI